MDVQDTRSYNKMFEVLCNLGAFPIAGLTRVMLDYEMALLISTTTNLPWASVYASIMY
jgi:hypothetical protein